MLLKKITVIILLAGTTLVAKADQVIRVGSPNGIMQVELEHENDGKLFYKLFYKGKTVVASSGLGMELKSPLVSLRKFDLAGIDSSYVDESWKPVWGEVSSIRNNYRQLVLRLNDRSGSGIQLQIIFRVFDDGIGFRYSFPQQSKLNHFIISEELTQFDMTGDHKTFWIPGDYDTNEFMYNTSKL